MRGGWLRGAGLAGLAGLAGCPQPADDWAPAPPAAAADAAAQPPAPDAGRALLGGACAAAADCATGRLEPACERGEGFVGGYCVGLDCRPEGADCGPLGVCVAEGETGRCFARCPPEDPTGCRVGYACGRVLGAPEAICAPSAFF